MLIAISVVFALYVLATSWYIRKLKLQLKTFETDWKVIEELTDQNKDGDVVIHCKHI